MISGVLELSWLEEGRKGVRQVSVRSEGVVTFLVFLLNASGNGCAVLPGGVIQIPIHLRGIRVFIHYAYCQ